MWSGGRWVFEHKSHLKNFHKSNISQNHNVHFPQWPEQDALIESANWEIPGYATGVYHVLVHNGKVLLAQWCKREWINHLSSKVMWEQAKITDDSNEPSGDCSAEKNIKAMDAYSKALQAGDMKSCLPVLVSLFCFSKMFLPPPRILPTPSVASAKFQCQELIFMAFSRRSGNR